MAVTITFPTTATDPVTTGQLCYIHRAERVDTAIGYMTVADAQLAAGNYTWTVPVAARRVISVELFQDASNAYAEVANWFNYRNIKNDSSTGTTPVIKLSTTADLDSGNVQSIVYRVVYERGGNTTIKVQVEVTGHTTTTTTTHTT